MDYPRGKFGDCSLSHFGSVVWTDKQTHKRRQMQMNSLLLCLSSARVTMFLQNYSNINVSLYNTITVSQLNNVTQICCLHNIISLLKEQMTCAVCALCPSCMARPGRIVMPACSQWHQNLLLLPIAICSFL